MNAIKSKPLTESMATTHLIVQRYADQWRNLRAWGAPLPMRIEVAPYKGTDYQGLAWAGACKALVCITGNLARDLAILLHEMAHLAAPNSAHHGIQWKRAYARAAAEALECDVEDFDLDLPKNDLDQLVQDMAEVWLESR